MDSYNVSNQWIHAMDSHNGFGQWIHAMDSYNGLNRWIHAMDAYAGLDQWIHAMSCRDNLADMYKIINTGSSDRVSGIQFRRRGDGNGYSIYLQTSK